ncbi:MAG: hypothetical protein IKD71_02045 [Solobacterium sp.]|nr:hypothetical protein [Solobacterium sp.]
MLKQFLITVLSGILATSSLPVSYYDITVPNKDDVLVQEAKAFVKDKGFYLGEVLSIVETENSVTFTMDYLADDEPAKITYINSGSTKEIIVDEGIIVNEICYTADGAVYIDGFRSPALESKGTSGTRSYVQYWSEAAPADAEGSYYSYYSYDSSINVGILIRNCTIAVLVNAIGNHFSVPTSIVNFYTICSSLRDFAIANALGTTYLGYRGYAYRNDSKYPGQIFYMYSMRYYVANSPEHPKTYYRTDILC